MYENGKGYKDSYMWFAPCRFLDRKTVEIVGAQKAPKPSEWKAVLRAFREQGVETVEYRQFRDGESRVRRRSTSKY